MSPSTRQAIAECVIGLSVCVAAHLVLVRPTERELTKASAQWSDMISRGAGEPPVLALAPSRLQELLLTTKQQSSVVARRGTPARDEAAMFADVMSLASATKVRIDQIQPVGAVPDPKTRHAQPPTVPGANTNEPPVTKDVAVGYSISVAASYTDLIDFLNGLAHSTGYTVVKSVHVTPARGDPLRPLAVVIETEHHSFDVSTVDSLIAAGQRAGADLQRPPLTSVPSEEARK